MALLKPPEKPDKRWRRPETREATIRMIKATYALNNWTRREQSVNEKTLGLDRENLDDYSDAELNVILDDMVLERMILLEEEKNESGNNNCKK